MDSGLAKSAPFGENLSQKTYRSYRRRLVLFSKQCHRRGRETAVEGAFLAVSLLGDSAWEATEHLDLEALETSEKPFDLITKLLDGLYQYEELVEVPSRCEEFFQDFSRNKGEDMQSYLVRHMTMMKRMKEVKVEIPKLLAGWHLLTRSGVPKWTHVQVKSMCGGELDYDKVSLALMRMFGGDHRPNPKDLNRQGRDEAFYEEDQGEDDCLYEEEGYEDWFGDGEEYGYGHDEECYYEDAEEPLPSDVESAVDQTEEAYVNYLESRRRMRDLALSRGFYPIVALGPEVGQQAYGRKGDGKGKGKGKSKGGKSKGKGKSKSFTRTFQNRRPMSGLRRSNGTTSTSASSTTSASSGSELRSTLSGSTAQHGPRFKRYRMQSSGVKEVPEEQIAMVAEEVICESNYAMDECFFQESAVGQAIVDSGASRTIVGEDVWRKWLGEIGQRGRDLQAETKSVVRDFRFGDGGVARSHYEVEFNAGIKKQPYRMVASVIAGNTPFLISRTTLEDMKVKQDFGEGKMKVLDSEWFQPGRGRKGHYILDIFDFDDDADMVNYVNVAADEVLAEKEDVNDVWTVEPVLEHHAGTFQEEKVGEVEVEDVKEMVNMVSEKTMRTRGLEFWEVYVDGGNLSKYMLKEYQDVTVATFGLPDWDFSKPEVREAFISLLRKRRPHFVWYAPPCTEWSPIQGLNSITEDGKLKLEMRRDEAEASHLELVRNGFEVGAEEDIDSAVEHPDRAASWSTETWSRMENFFDAKCDRCRTGLVYRNRDGQVVGKVKKSTRIRTTSRMLAEEMNLACRCKAGEHVMMVGKSNALKKMQNYENGFVRRATRGIYKEMEKNWIRRETVNILVTEEVHEGDVEMTDEKELQVAKSNTRVAKQVVAKLHRQLGHPNNDKLMRALRQAKMEESIVQFAKNYKCDVCASMKQKELEKPASLSQASHFNEIIEMDIFHLKWDGVKRKVFAIIDVYSRFETNAVVSNETLDEELEVIMRQWVSWAGFPKQIRTDSSGARMSEAFQSWCDDNRIKLTLVPKEAHHRMGLVERLHAVRRQQLHKMKAEKTDLKLEDAVWHACAQRNRLRTVHGSSPTAIVFGFTPSDGGILDEPNAVKPYGRPAHQEDEEIRQQAAKAFYEANHSNAIRRALLAKSRIEHVQHEVGEYVYYWRTSNDKLEPSRWRGPALVCMVEPRAEDGVQRPSVYWLAHGSSLVRVAPEHVRPEVGSERATRLETMPQTAVRQPLQEQLVQTLQPVRGPVRFLTLSGQEGPNLNVLAPDPSADDSPEPEPQRRRKEEASAQQQREVKTSTLSSTTPAAKYAKPMASEAEEAPASGVLAETQDEKIRIDQEVTDLFEEAERHSRSKEKSQERERSRSPREKEALRRSIEMSRKLDGLPIRPVATEEKMEQKEEQKQESDEELLAEEFNEKRLTPEEKKQFDEAKDKALMVWIDNQAWKAAPMEQVRDGEMVPARFLQRWKKTENGEVANARVIIQGFRHKDVMNEKLETEAPTLSRLGRFLILNMLVHKKWKAFSADVKSAFMQADQIDEETRIYIRPSADMRRRLERLMGLKPDEVLRAVKPAFGDVRAPRQWNDSADKAMTQEIKMVRHPLDRCVYMSTRLATVDDEEFCCYHCGEECRVVDGVLGLHVDDYIGGGENVFSASDLEGDYDGQFPCFRDRLCGLARRFRFGNWSFGEKMQFCGAEVCQSLDFETMSISMEDYVKSVKPISIAKHRKTMSDDPCNEVEKKQLRALIGAVAWPANQCLPQASATTSLLQASMASPCVKDINEANKFLRYLKEATKGFKLNINRHGNLENMRFGAYTDAAWAVRPDSTSQGGYLLFVAGHEEIEAGYAMKLSIVDWCSKKLQRICRSSLSAESQAATSAIDALEWTKVFWAAMLWPGVSIEEEDTMKKIGSSPVLVDAKALYDAVLSLAPGLKLSEKRTAIEVAIMRDRLQAMDGKLRWLNSSQQLADGLTKVQARDQMNYQLMRGIHRLVFDPNYTAAKKVKKEDKEVEKEELEAASKEIYEGQIFVTLEEKESKEGKCALEGCNRLIDSADTRHRFCSRRHYYLDFHRKNGNSDQWKKAAFGALATLSLAEIPVAEAVVSEKAESFSDDVRMIITVVVIVVFAGYGVIEFVKATVNVLILKLKDVSKNDAVPENVNARASHVDGGHFVDYDKEKVSKNDMMKTESEEGSGASSSIDVMKKNKMVIESEVGKKGVDGRLLPRDEYERQTGERRGDEPESGKPLDTEASRTFGTPEYFEMKTYWHRQYTNQKVSDKSTQSPVTYTYKNAHPRFTPLGERAHGAWYAVNNFELKS